MQYSYLNTSIGIDQKYAEMNIIEKLTWEQWNVVGVGNIEEMRKRRGRKLKEEGVSALLGERVF